MFARGVNPILNVSDIKASFEWFKKLGWSVNWEWGEPVGFGAVGSGEVEIFLCLNAQGGRGQGSNATTFTVKGDEQADKGVWMSLWVNDIDEVHKHCVAHEIDVTFQPTNMPWGVREMHIRHMDGHVFRLSEYSEP